MRPQLEIDPYPLHSPPPTEVVHICALVKPNYVILSLRSFLILSSCEALILGLSFVAYTPHPPLADGLEISSME